MRTQKERREYYRKMESTMTQEEIIHAMPDDELCMNARRGGINAITELERRAAERDHHIIPQPDINIGV